MIYIYPGPGPRPAITLFQKASRSIRLNTYEITDRRVERALADARAKGVRVEILLSRRVYRSPDMVRHELAWCRRTQIACRLSPTRFRFDHAKYFLVDGTIAWIGSLNMTFDGFSRNREAALVTSAPSLVRATRAVFRADWHDQPAGHAPRRALVLSPHSGFAFRSLLTLPGPIAIETEEFYPPRRLQHAMERLGRQLRLILPARAVYGRGERNRLCLLATAGVRIRLLRSPYPHIKLILTPRATFLGSQNFSRTSLESNREAGVLLGPGTSSSHLLYRTFERDWHAARRLSCSPSVTPGAP